MTTDALPSGRTRDLAVSTVVLIVGAGTVAWLTRYNLQPYSVSSTPMAPAVRSWEEYLVVNLTALMLAPMLVAWLTPGLTPVDFGWRAPGRAGARTAAAMFLAMLPVLAVASRWPAFHDYYPIVPQAAMSWTMFTYHELSYGLYMLAWEWFYRGFLTHGLARGYGAWTAVALQALAFGIMHIGKPAPEIAGSFIAGVALGIVALRTRSFVPCFLTHWAVSITFDVLAILWKPGGIL